MNVRSAFSHTFVRDRNLANISFFNVNGSFFEGNHLQNSNRNHLFSIVDSCFQDIFIVSKINFIDMSSRHQTAYIDLFMKNVSFKSIRGPVSSRIYLLYLLRLQVVRFLSVSFENISTLAGIGFYKILDNPNNYPSWIEIDNMSFQNKLGEGFRCLMDVLYITNFTITNSVFNAESEIADDFFIFLETNVNLGSLSVINSTFSTIRTRQYGALRVNIINGNSLIIKNCSFISNYAPNYGSDIDLLFKERTTVTASANTGISDCLFKNSQSQESGAIHLSESGDVFAKNCLFINGYSKTRGAGITINKLSIMITQNLTFTNCESLQSGGSIWLEGLGNLTAFNTSIFDSKGGLGGALYIEGVAVFKSIVIKNCKGQEGGIVYLKNGNMTLSSASFMISASKLRGGHIFAKEGSISIKGAEFLSSHSEENGGSSYFELMKSVEISSALFKDCHSSKSGTLYLYSLSTAQSSFDNISFVSNTADLHPGIVAEEGRLLIKSLVFRNNSAIKYGLISFFSNFQISEVTLETVRIEDNYGGETLVMTQNNKLNLSLGTFNGNSVTKRIFFCLTGTVVISAASVTTRNGGSFTSARFIEANELVINISDTQISGASSLGGLQAVNSDLILKSCRFSLCKASKGGVLSLQKSALKVEASQFSENEAEEGGAIYSVNSQIEILNCLFTGNRVVFQEKSSDVSADNWLTSESFKVLIFFSNFSEFAFNSILLAAGTNATLVGLTIRRENQFNTTLAAVSIQQFASVVIRNSAFLRLGSSGAVAIDSSTLIKSQAFLLNNSFVGCLNTNKGGALTVSGNAFELMLELNQFSLNAAGKSGGAVYFDCLTTNCRANLTKNTFADNKAEVYGNTLAQSRGMEIFREANTITSQNSSAIEFSGFPSKMVLVLLTSEISGYSQEAKVEYLKAASLKILTAGGDQEFELVSGPKVDFAAVVFDNYNNFYFLESASKLEILNTADEFVILENNKQITTKNFVFFSGFSIVAPPDRTYLLHILFSNSDYAFEAKFGIRLRRCKRGEIFLNQQCNPCGPEFYSLDPDPVKNNVSSCLACPSNFWCLGGDMLLAKQGFFRASGNSSVATRCNYNQACPDQRSNGTYLNLSVLGTNSSAKNQSVFYLQSCAQSYEGRLCATCAEGFAVDSNFVCIECKENTNYWVRMSLGLFLSCMLMIYQAHEVWKFSEFDSLKRSLFKILINHMYYLTFLTGFNINWSEDLFNFIRGANQYASIIPSESINYNCILFFLTDRENLFYVKNIVLSCTPLMILVVCMLMRIFIEMAEVLIAYILKRINVLSLQRYNSMTSKSNLKNKLFSRFISLSIVIFYNIYSRILVNTVKLLSCITADDSDPAVYLEINPETECYSSEHKKFILNLFIPNVLVWCLGWPTLIFLIIRTKSTVGDERKSFLKKITNSLNARGIQIDDEQIRNFFVLDYKPSAYYWELFFYGIGFFTAILQVTTSRLTPLTQGAFLSGLYALALLFTEAKRPFKRTSMNSMNTLSYLTIIATISLAVLTSIDKVSQDYQVVWLIGIYIANSSFYLYWLYFYMRIVGLDFLTQAKAKAKKTIEFVKKHTVMRSKKN